MPQKPLFGKKNFSQGMGIEEEEKSRSERGLKGSEQRKGFPRAVLWRPSEACFTVINTVLRM